MAFSFGAAPKPATSTFGGFGAASAPQQAGATPAPSLFGQPAASTTATPSLFGAAQPAAPAAGTSLFGQPQSQPVATGGLFGAAPAQPAAGATPSLFGAASQPSTTPSLFGAAQPAASTAPSLFGAAAPAQPSTTPSLFGQPAASAAPAQPSLFGGSSLFGSTPTAGSQQPAAQTPSLFGQSQSAQPFGQTSLSASASLFGAKPALSTSTLAPASAPVPKLGDPYPPPSPNEKPIETRIEALKDAWDTTNPKCRFQTYFYNAPAQGTTVEMYKNPPPGADEAIWFKAVRENPDPEHLVPALALGFSALSKRIESQNKLTASHGALLDEVSKHLSTLSSTHSLQTSLRVMRATQNSQALTGRLLALIAKSSALSPNRNMSVRKEEEALRVGLEKLEVEVKAEGERVNALWAGVGAVKARAEREGKGDRREWGVADEEGLEKVSEILSQQQAGLDHLIKTLVAADRDLDVMKEAFGLPTGSGAAVKPRQ